jgi:hypothetical protein
LDADREGQDEVDSVSSAVCAHDLQSESPTHDALPHSHQNAS